MIKKLILNNWKSHKHTEIEFYPSYNVIVGNIGSGKTSIFDAIVFCLFGTTPNANSRKIAVKDLIMSKPVKQEESNISLELEIEGNIYRIERFIHKTKSSQAKIYKNDVLLRGPKPSDVNEEVEKILKINLDTFMKSNYAEQNSIDYFLKLPAHERKTLFDNLFDISFYDDIAINSRQVKNKLKTKYDSLLIKENEYNQLLQNYNKNEIEEKIKSISKEISKLKEEVKNIEKNLNIEKIKEQKIIKQKLEYETTNNLLNNLIGKARYLESELENLKEFKKEDKSEIELKYQKLKTNKDLKTKEKTEIEQQYNNIISKILFYKNKLQEFNSKQNEFLKIDNKIKQIPKDINEIVNNVVKKIEEIRDSVTQKETKINALQKEIETLEKAQAVCPTCNQELTEEHKKDILTQKKNKRDILKSSISKEREHYSNLKKEYTLKNSLREYYNRNFEYYTKLKTELLDLNKYNKLLSDNEKLEKQSKERIFGADKELHTIESELKEYENKLKQILDLNKKQNDLEKLKENIELTKQKLKNITYNPEEYTIIKSSIQKTETEIHYKKQIIIEKERQSKDEQFKLNQYNNILKNLNYAKKESRLLKNYINDLNIISNVSKKTQEQVRQYVIESVNLIFQDLWQHIYPYKDFQNIRFNITGGDYKIELYFNNEYKRELDEYISGGERSTIALALRIAMCLVMKNKLNLIILDEPTHNLDKKTVLALSELFTNYLPKFLDQIFVITHDPDLKQYAKNVYHIERDKETDSASEIFIN